MRSLCTIGVFLLAPSLARADGDSNVIRRAFSSDADAAAIEKVACSLQPRGKNVSRPFAVRVGDKACDSRAATDAIELVVRIVPHDGAREEVAIEAVSPDEASTGDVTAVVELTARALEGSLSAAVPKQVKGPWYGWQNILGIIAVDVAGTAGVIAVDAAANGQIAPIALAAVVAVSAHVFMGPIVHLLHHEPRDAARSLALELGLPLATSLTALGLAALSSNGRVDYPLNALALGAIPGAVIAPIIDAAAFSTEHVDAGMRHVAARSFAVVPVVAPATVGLDAVASF